MPPRLAFLHFPGLRPAGLARALRFASPALAFALAVLAALALAPPPAEARAERLPGPIPARVERVIDGDTLAVRVRVWLGQELSVRVRIRGIDAAEPRGRCEGERVLAARARDWLKAAIGAGEVRLTDIGGGKYYGRVLAEVWDLEGRNLGAALVAAGLAVPYDGGRRPDCCAEG